MLDRLKLILVVLFFIGLLVFSGRAQKEVLEQKDPAVLNFLAAGYCPGVVQGGQAKPLEEMNRIKREWEAIAADKYRQQLPGFDRQWKVRFLENPDLGAAKSSWALTRLMGGMAPEFMYSMATPEFSDRCHHWYIDLSPYLNQPNPYVPGNKRWIDIFYPGALGRWRSSADRHLYCIPIDQVEIAIFYNKKIMAACGIDMEKELASPEWDWHRFIELQKQIKDNGYVPFLMPAANNMRLLWMHDILNDMLFAEVYDQLNAVDDPDMPEATSLSGQEKVRALKKGLVSLQDDRYWETWRIIRDWSNYWQEGYLGSADVMSFQLGRAAMIVDGSWFVKTLESDEQRDFEYGTFFVPRLTTRTSPFAIGSPPRGVGGSTAIQYSITKETATRKEAVEACVDLLMYLSAPQNLGVMVAEGQSFLPTVRNCEQYFEGSPLKFMLPVLEAGSTRCTGFDDLDTRCRDEWWAIMQEFLDGKIDRSQVIAKMQKAVDRGILDQMEKYKDQWHWIVDENGTQTWEIAPPVSRLKTAAESSEVTQ